MEGLILPNAGIRYCKTATWLVAVAEQLLLLLLPCDNRHLLNYSNDKPNLQQHDFLTQSVDWQTIPFQILA